MGVPSGPSVGLRGGRRDQVSDLVVLGAGSILPRAGYGCAGYALLHGSASERRAITLLDCGPGTLRSLGERGLRLEDLRRVVFSHYHLDHCLDLFALAFARRNPALFPEGAPRLEVFGPRGLNDLVERAPHALGRWAQDPNVEVHEIAVDEKGWGGFVTEEARFRCVENGHCPEAVSWRIELPDGLLAYSGDTGPAAVVAEVAREVDLFVLECSFPEGAGTPNHLTPTQAGTLVREARARRCLLSHFYPEQDPEEAKTLVERIVDVQVEVARDGSVHPVRPERTMRVPR